MQSVPPQLAAGACALPIILIAWRVCGSYLNRFFTRKFTVLHDVDNLGKARTEQNRIKGTAVICGGSIAGLWTARIAADHFEDVLIVEPEAWVHTEEGQSNTCDKAGEYVESSREHVRTRVMQYDADHTFQPIALDALRKLFPDADEEIKSSDARIVPLEVNVHSYGKEIMKLPKDEYPDGNYPQCFFMTREMYERVLRRLVLNSSKRIRSVVGTATGVKTIPGDPTTLSSVTVRAAEGAEENVPATLVIDCTGGTQAGLKWIRRIANEPAHADALQRLVPAGALPWDDLRVEYNTKQRYIRFRFYVPPEARARLPIPGGYARNTWMYTYMPVPGVERKLYMINRIEGHRIELAFGGWGEPPLPLDFDDIKNWFKALEVDHHRCPDWIYPFVDALLEYRHLASVATGRYPGLSWVHFERAPFIPSNFIAIGDSVMRVNPTFGQGCSKATIGAVALDAMLRTARYARATKISSDFGRSFFTMHVDKIQHIWDGTKPTDYQWDTTTPVKGEKNSDEWLAGAIGSLAMQLAGTDKTVDSVMYKVRMFMAPPTAMLAPSILGKIILFAARQKLGLATE
ncbi:hypothetical protein DFH11DRAFT_1503246 [Phellopilus nigrolimitatus]|nr:hypothetical protein DFH11DRAFT_1503246 [Phellopilus nigrolimitatus]